jgi:hypothetical protein
MASTDGSAASASPKKASGFSFLLFPIELFYSEKKMVTIFPPGRLIRLDFLELFLYTNILVTDRLQNTLIWFDFLELFLYTNILVTDRQTREVIEDL